MADGDNGAADFSDAELRVLDRRTVAIGRELFQDSLPPRASILQRRWWDEQLLALAMADARLKTQLFRFVDVLPTLTDSDDLVDHLQQYLLPVRDRLPVVARSLLGVGRKTWLTRAAIARLATLGTQDLARRFIAGTNVPEVVASACRERELGRCFTLDILGEAVTSEREAERFFQAYLDLLEQVGPLVNAWPIAALDSGGAGPRLNLSIKLSALDCRFDPIDPSGVLRRAGERFRELLRAAHRHGAFINVDMESYDKKDLTLWLFRQVLQEAEFRQRTHVGIVIQCYLRDADRDLAELADWSRRRGAPVWVRLVKGAYWDYESIHAQSAGWPVPVFTTKPQTDASFERATRFVMRHVRHLRPALGTHNLRSIAHGMAVAEHCGCPPSDYEFQMLYGMADPEKQAITRRGQRLRIYMPYGELIPGMAYLVRRLLENTSDDSFLRAGFLEHVSPDALLRSPRLAAAPSPHSPLTLDQRADAMPTTAEPATRLRFCNEPPVDFAHESNRHAMREALAAVLAQLGGRYPLVIDGVEIVTSETIASRDPSHKDRLVGEVCAAHRTHVDLAVEAAQRGQADWAALGAVQRAATLRAAAKIMRDRLFELAAWEIVECGKGWREAAGDVVEAIDFCEYYAAGAIALETPAGGDVPGEENRFEYVPRGVAAVIAPWNFPLAIITGMTAAALATGNAVIMKPAEQASVTAAKLMEIWRQAGVPAGAVHFLPGTGEVVGAALVEHPDVAVIAFTGSRSVGLSINARAAAVSAGGLSHVKRVIAEMGGKNAIIVDADADLDESVLGVLGSAFGYQGQKCSACSRVIVHAAIHDAFLERLVEAARSLEIGPAENPGAVIGPVIDQAAFRKVHEYIRLGRQEGREALAVPAGDWTAHGWYVGPHIFSDLPPTSRLAQEEVFGPVLAVFRAADFGQAIQMALGSEYALTGGVYSRSPANLERAKREFLVGNLYLNRPITGAVVGRQPFGGFKLSGIGSKAGGPDYLLQFVLPRTITENTLRRGFAPSA